MTVLQFKGFEITIPNIRVHKTISSPRANSDIPLSEYSPSDKNLPTIYAPVFKLLKTVREVQRILKQLRAFQLPDKILGTGKSRLLGHHLVQRPQAHQWCYQVCLTESRTNWGHPPLRPPWPQVPEYKNIFLYSVKKQDVFQCFEWANHLSAPTLLAGSPPQAALIVWLADPVTQEPHIHSWPKLSCPVTPFLLQLPLRQAMNVSGYSASLCQPAAAKQSGRRFLASGSPSQVEHTAATQPQPEC